MPLITLDPKTQQVSTTAFPFTIDPKTQPLARAPVPPPPRPPRPTGGAGSGGRARPLPECPPGHIWSERWHRCIPIEQYEQELKRMPSEEEFYAELEKLPYDDAVALALAFGLGIDERPYALTAVLIALAIQQDEGE